MTHEYAILNTIEPLKSPLLHGHFITHDSSLHMLKNQIVFDTIWDLILKTKECGVAHIIQTWVVQN